MQSHRRGGVSLVLLAGVAALWHWASPGLAWVLIGRPSLQQGQSCSRRSYACIQAKAAPGPELLQKVQAILEEAEREAKASDLSADSVVYELILGNKRFVAGTRRRIERSAVDTMVEDPYKPAVKKAVVLSCASQGVSAESLFDAGPGEVQSLKVMGYASGDHDGVMSSVDYALTEGASPLLVVLGDSNNEAIQTALRVAMEEQGLEGAPPSKQKLSIVEESELGLVKKLLPACRDALLQVPNADFATLLEVAAKLNVWTTIQILFTTSPTVYNRVLDGSLEVQGAFVDDRTGAVQMLGRHPSQARLMRTPPADDRVRTASSPGVPPEEAYAALVAGNRRFTSQKGSTETSVDDLVLLQLGEGGQKPMAAILGCADSRAPVELVFDKRPGDLFVLRTAGNIITNTKSALLGSAEFAIAALKTKFVVVSGHTKCGAVTEAVKAVRSNANLKEVPGSIGDLLADLMEAAEEAVRQLPDASIPEQVTLATKINVFNGVQRLIAGSDIIRDAVVKMEVQVYGAVYDIVTGNVEWLGQHPELESIVGTSMPVYQWKTTPYTRTISPMGAKAQEVVDKLQAGNARFAAGQSEQELSVTKVVEEPMGIVISGSEVRVSVLDIFDAAPGELVTQKCLGNIVGIQGGTLFSSLEYAVHRYSPPVLIVLGYSDDPVVKLSLEEVEGSEVPPFAMLPVLDQVGVATVRALEQVGGEGRVSTTAGSDMQVMRLAVEFNIWYGIEQLILNSAIIREAVKQGMEVQGAVLDHLTGKVEFLGPHPIAEQLLELGDG